VLDGVACLVVAYVVAALLGLDPLAGAGEFVVIALAGGAVYGSILILVGTVREGSSVLDGADRKALDMPSLGARRMA
jgi:hypothetical protein